MPTPEELFGIDLRLLRDVERQSSRSPGEDLATVPRPGRAHPGEPDPDDLDRWAGVDNLSQALLLRLLTWRGELAPLGHPAYGSRLHELIGELNTETVRNRAKMYVLTALADEPRIRRVVSVQVTPSRRVREQIDIDLVLEAIESTDELRLSIPFSLAGGAA
jgi:phage baseplate assembly protein W